MIIPSINVCCTLAILPKDIQLTICVGDFNGFGHSNTSESQYDEPRSMDTGTPEFNDYRLSGNTVLPSVGQSTYPLSQGCNFVFPMHPLQVSPYPMYSQYQPPGGYGGPSLPYYERGSYPARANDNLAHEGIPPGYWDSADFSRCEMCPRYPANLTANISELFSGVSDPHLSAEVCGYSISKHAGIDLMSSRTNFQVNTHPRPN